MFLLCKITVISFVFLSLYCYSCALLKSSEFPPDPIIGKWELVKTTSGGRPAPENNITQPYPPVKPVNVIFEFKPDNTLTIQGLRQNNHPGMLKSGNYQYSYTYSNDDEPVIRIGNTDWRYYYVSENKLMIGQAHVGGTNYFLERMSHVIMQIK